MLKIATQLLTSFPRKQWPTSQVVYKFITFPRLERGYTQPAEQINCDVKVIKTPTITFPRLREVTMITRAMREC